MSKDVKQTIFVNGILHNADQAVLLVQRSSKDSFLPSYWELPGGRVNLGETLEHALRRKLSREVGVSSGEALYFCSIAQVDRSGPYTRIAFEVNGVADINVQLTSSHDAYKWVSKGDIHKLTIASDARAIIEQYLGDIEPQRSSKEVSNTTYTIFTDGGSRGNPGPSASAYVVYGADQGIIETGGEYIGITTNNQAEYTAVLLGLRAVKQHARPTDVIIMRMDSLLVANQMNGVYKIKNRDLWPIHQQIREQMKVFSEVRFEHVPREQNIAADTEVNRILDAQKSS